jgi:anti-sigma regulatory factor (Ser/Thr protein kinase)
MIINIKSNPSELKDLRVQIKKYLDENFKDLKVDEILLAIDEAVQNIIRHAYKMKADQPIDIEIQKTKNFSIKIRDYGKQVELSSIAPRKLDEVRPGGLGVHFIRTICKNVKYEHAKDNKGGTILTLDF